VQQALVEHAVRKALEAHSNNGANGREWVDIRHQYGAVEKANILIDWGTVGWFDAEVRM
jgi:hypothetical protein